MTVRLTRAKREALDLHVALAVVTRLVRHWPLPGDIFHAVLAQWELGVTIG